MPYDSMFTILEKEYWPNGKAKHQLWDDGEEVYYDENHKYHRIDGPAITFSTGRKEYWVHGCKVDSLEEAIIKNIIE